MTNPSVWNPSTNIPVSNANSTLVPQAFVAIAAQTLFNITLFAYTPNVGGLLVFINGIAQIPGTDFTETSGTSFTISTPLVAGDVVLAFGFVGVTATTASVTALAAAAAASATAAANSATASGVSATAAATSATAAAASAVSAAASAAAVVVATQDISNLGLSASCAANALTINLLDGAGATPTAGSSVKISFRNSTITTGTRNIRTVTATLSLVVSSGSTLGHKNATAQEAYVYALDNAGTVELAISSTLFDDETIVSTTAEGGAGASDANNIIYSTTARANVPIKLIGRIVSTQATAGTWVTNPNVAVYPFVPKRFVCSLRGSASQASNASGGTFKMQFNTVITDSHNSADLTNFRITVNKTGDFNISAGVYVARDIGGQFITDHSLLLYKNGSLLRTLVQVSLVGGSALANGLNGNSVEPLVAGDYIEIYANATTSGGGTFSITFTQPLSVTQIN